jgi:cell pole-organizing protein PopZ
MNANNANQTSLQAEQKAHEPSMEDILASIRKIIADDDALPLSRRAAPATSEPERSEPLEAQQPTRNEPPAPPPAVQPLAPVPTPMFVARAPLKPPPIPSLRELAQRLDELPSSLTPARARIEPAPLELRPSLGAPPQSPEARAEASAPQPAPVFVPPAEPAAESAPEAPAPKATVSFETGGFKAPPLSFKANVPPPASFSPAPVVTEPVDSPAPEPVVEPEARVVDIPPVEPVRPAPVATSQRGSILPPARLDRVEPTMLSEQSGLKVGAAFEALAESALLRDPELVERMTREILRPLIKTWLDDNLPNVVERLVRAEIERVARGPKI